MIHKNWWLRWLIVGLVSCGVIGLARPVRADELAVTITQIDAPNYPQVQVTVECQHWPLAGSLPRFQLRENNQPQASPEPALVKLQPVNIVFLLDIPVTRDLPSAAAQTMQQRSVDLLRTFDSDRCRWSPQDRVTVYAPAFSTDGQRLQAVPVTEFNNQLAVAANKVQQFTLQAKRATDPAGFFTATLDELNSSVAGLTHLVILSDGTFPASSRSAAQSAYVAVQALARSKAQLYAILLADAPVQDAGYLQNLVGVSNFCASNDPTCLRALWQRWTTPNQYHFTYTTQSQPPFEIGVAPIITGTTGVVAATRSFWLDVQPLHLKILDPAPGADVAVTAPITTTPLPNRSQPLMAHVEIQWPPLAQSRRITSLTYQLNQGNHQTLATAIGAIGPRHVFDLPLGRLPLGKHTLQVRLEEEINTLAVEAITFFAVTTQTLAIAQNTYNINENQQTMQQTTNYLGRFLNYLAWAIGLVGSLGLLVLLIAWFWRRRLHRQQEQDRNALQALQAEVDKLLRTERVATFSGDTANLRAGLFLLQGIGLPSFIPIMQGETIVLGSNLYAIAERDASPNVVRVYYLLNNRYVDDPQCVIKHQIIGEEEEFVISDGNDAGRGSANGTFVNNVKLVLGTASKLRSGDVLKFGPMVGYTFRIKTSDEPLPISRLPQSAAQIAKVQTQLSLPGEKDETKIITF